MVSCFGALSCVFFACAIRESVKRVAVKSAHRNDLNCVGWGAVQLCSLTPQQHENLWSVLQKNVISCHRPFHIDQGDGGPGGSEEVERAEVILVSVWIK